jgi:hypothetical protein
MDPVFSGTPFIDTLRLIYNRLLPSQVEWAVTGSLGFALQGVKVSPHDIDLQTNKTGTEGICRLLNEFLVTPVFFRESEKMHSYYGMLEMNGLQIEVMGDVQKRLADGVWEAPVDIRPFRTWVTLEQMRIPVLSLEYEREAYRKMGRIEKAEMLELFLKDKKFKE